MKKIAFILLIFFSLVQAGPAFSFLFAENAVVFLIDEEKETEKTEIEKKIKKDCTIYSRFLTVYNQKNQVAYLIAEKLQTSPVLENPTPPPDLV